MAIDSCPTSYVTAESKTLVEEFWLRRRLGGFRADQLTAREAEAFFLLEQELAMEIKDGEQLSRHTL